MSAVLLVLPLLVYASHANLESVPGPVRRTVSWLTSYPERAVVWVVESGQDAWYGYVDLRHVRDENLELKKQTIAVSMENAKATELADENTRLRRMLGYAEGLPDVRMVAASVIGYGPDPKFRGVRIARGSEDGLRVGMPVVTPDGVVGRLLNVDEKTSDVLLVTDPSSAVAALSQRTRARATVRGLGTSEHLKLDYVIKSDDLEESDILVTAPSGGLFPKGLRIGRATHVGEAANGLFKTAELVPFVDFGRLEEVLVVVDNGPSARVDRPATAVAQ